MLSPMIAPAIEHRSTSSISSLPVAPASTAAVTSIVSPGSGMPRLSIATNANTASRPNPRAACRSGCSSTRPSVWSDERESRFRAMRVQPRAKRDEVVGERAGAVVIRLAAPPVDGKASGAARAAACRVGSEASPGSAAAHRVGTVRRDRPNVCAPTASSQRFRLQGGASEAVCASTHANGAAAVADTTTRRRALGHYCARSAAASSRPRSRPLQLLNRAHDRDVHDLAARLHAVRRRDQAAGPPGCIVQAADLPGKLQPTFPQHCGRRLRRARLGARRRTGDASERP